jgi:prepilin-type N-terminal cleavage/methylation domain-containing protein
MTGTRGQRGFSMVELLVGAAVALIGLYASLNMAIYALHANQERRDSIAAEQFAEHLLSTIQAESVFWTDAVPPAVGWYLYALPPFAQGATTGWQLVPGTELSDYKRVGRMGSDWLYDSGIRFEIASERGATYCAFWRLTWVTDSLVRAEVKVAWQRQTLNVDKYKDCPVTMTDDVGNVGTMTLPAMVMKNVYVQ